MPRFSPDRWLGLITLIAALVILFVWIPLDVDSGIADRVRRRLVLGDALAPTVAATLLGLAGLILFLQGGEADGPSLDWAALKWIVALFAVLTVSLAIMRWTGPLATAFLGAGEYRLLRATFPWSYLGFVTGGTVLVFGLISLSEGRMRTARLALAVIAVLVMAAFYDLPFDDLLLPPNGDV